MTRKRRKGKKCCSIIVLVEEVVGIDDAEFGWFRFTQLLTSIWLSAELASPAGFRVRVMLTRLVRPKLQNIPTKEAILQVYGLR